MRLFVSSCDVHDAFVSIEPDDFHHLSRVLRIKKNETIDIVVDETRVLISRFNYFKDNRLYYDLERVEVLNKSPLKITLVQALVKQDKFARIVNDTTQCGVHTIIPLQMERSIVKWDENKKNHNVARWSECAKHAAIQSKQSFIPRIHSITTLSDFLKCDLSQYDCCLVAWEEMRHSNLANTLADYSQLKSLCLVIGPEGGITEKEVTLMKSFGFSSISLGATIFRVELAAVVALSQLNCCNLNEQGFRE